MGSWWWYHKPHNCNQRTSCSHTGECKATDTTLLLLLFQLGTASRAVSMLFWTSTDLQWWCGGTAAARPPLFFSVTAVSGWSTDSLQCSALLFYLILLAQPQGCAKSCLSTAAPWCWSVNQRPFFIWGVGVVLGVFFFVLPTWCSCVLLISDTSFCYRDYFAFFFFFNQIPAAFEWSSVTRHWSSSALNCRCRSFCFFCEIMIRSLAIYIVRTLG